MAKEVLDPSGGGGWWSRRCDAGRSLNLAILYSSKPTLQYLPFTELQPISIASMVKGRVGGRPLLTMPLARSGHVEVLFIYLLEDGARRLVGAPLTVLTIPMGCIVPPYGVYLYKIRYLVKVTLSLWDTQARTIAEGDLQ